MGMKRPKRPTESRPGKDFQTGSSQIDSTWIDMSYSYWVLCGVGSTSQSSRVQDGGKSQHAKRSANNLFSAVVKEFGKDFHKTQLGRGGRCLA